MSDDSQAHEPRRSVRLKEKPVTIPVQSDEEEAKVDYKQKKKRFKSAPNSKTDNDIEIVAEKVAPIFLQIKKLEAEKAFKKAKQDFLQSSIPETLKQQVVLQSALEQRDVEIFPLVSHITQLESQCISLPSNVIFLNSLLRPVVNVSIPSSILFDPNLNRAQQVPITPINDRKSSVSEQNLEWLQCKDWIWHIKERHVNFPFFRCLRNMLVKGRTSEEHLWNDVCGTKHWNENLANTNTVHHLKQWLKEWKIKAGDVVEAAIKKKRSKAATVKRKRIDSDASELDAETVDDRSTSSEAWSDSDQLCNTMLIAGPPGCGKTASIYALAEELGFNVLEVNASSKRNGKSILSQLHEATQSHTLNNSSGNSNVHKFFRPTAVPTPKQNEQRTALSLVLFEDIDIVFESEDESFYSALTTLMNNSKRPIILTLTCSNESAISPVSDKVKSRFETLIFKSPDLTSICGQMWIFSLAEGYPLMWDVLQKFIKSVRPPTDYLDLRNLLLNLQFYLYHHSSRVTLNFNELQVTNQETQVSVVENSATSDQVSFNGFCSIDLPSDSATEEWPVLLLTKLPRFSYSEEEGFVQTNSSTSRSMKDPVPVVRSMDNLIACLNFRAFCDTLCSFTSRTVDLSLNDSTYLEEMEQIIMTRCTDWWKSEMELHNITDIVQPKNKRAHADVLLESYLPKRVILNRSATANDVLPYTRSICRSNLVHSMSKRRRTANSSGFRLPNSDAMVSPDVVLDVVNSL